MCHGFPNTRKQPRHKLRPWPTTTKHSGVLQTRNNFRNSCIWDGRDAIQRVCIHGRRLGRSWFEKTCHRPEILMRFSWAIQCPPPSIAKNNSRLCCVGRPARRYFGMLQHVVTFWRVDILVSTNAFVRMERIGFCPGTGTARPETIKTRDEKRVCNRNTENPQNCEKTQFL